MDAHNRLRINPFLGLINQEASTLPWLHFLNLCRAIGSIEGIPDLWVHNDLAFGEASLNGALARFPKARQHLQ